MAGKTSGRRPQGWIWADEFGDMVGGGWGALQGEEGARAEVGMNPHCAGGVEGENEQTGLEPNAKAVPPWVSVRRAGWRQGRGAGRPIWGLMSRGIWVMPWTSTVALGMERRGWTMGIV